jgi:DNA (cytosine-5)-methyltransferase 1
VRIGSLFAGYGGLDLGLSMIIDAEPVWFVEFDKHPSAVLAQRWPGVPNYGDVTAVDWSAVEPVDILTGGFPCQDVSYAGLRKGVRPGTRSGLWEHFAYAIQTLRPRLVVIENVSGLLSADAHCDVEPCPWCVGDEPDGHMRALGAVLSDLAEIGFDAEWASVRASDAGAPHRRERVFVVAADATRERHDGAGDAGPRRWAEPTDRGADDDGLTLLPTPAARDFKDQYVDNAGCHRPGDTDSVPRAVRDMDTDFGPYAAAIARWEAVTGAPAPAPTEPGSNGRPRLSPAFVEWMMGLPAGHVTGVGIPRSAQLKALGNGVVPAQAALALSLLLPRLYGGGAAKDAEEVA